MAFELGKVKGKVTHLNLREEKHGEEPVLACDIKVKADVANKFLDELSPGLRKAFYAKDAAQADIEEDHLTQIIFPQLAPLKWSVNMQGGEFTLHGAKKAEDLAWSGAAVKDATLALKEGGTVELTFQAAVLLTPDESGRLSALLGRDVKFSVKPVEQAGEPPLE